MDVATCHWLRPPRPERTRGADRIGVEASESFERPPPHALQLRNDLRPLARLLGGEVSEEDAQAAAQWLCRFWPWEIAGSFVPGGYRWILTGTYDGLAVFVLLCEAHGATSGSLDVIVSGGERPLPAWPIPPALPRSYVTVSLRSMPHGLHLWCHLDAADLDPDRVAKLITLAAESVKDAASGVGPALLGGARIWRATICARCSAVGSLSYCQACQGHLCFRVSWGPVRRPWWHGAVPLMLAILTPPIAIASVALLGVTKAAFSGILIGGWLVAFGLYLYTSNTAPTR